MLLKQFMWYPHVLWFSFSIYIIHRIFIFVKHDVDTIIFIQGSEHIPPEPEKVPNLMMYYIYNYNHDEQDISTKIAKYHIYFERIHPFEDGNGRIGRLLINYELLKNDLPPVVIAKEDRVKYFEFLRNDDCSGLSQWLKELSTREEERMEKFGYKK